MVAPGTFEERWKAGRDLVFYVAAALERQGAHIRIIPSACAPSLEERADYKDSGDAEITLRLEIKQRNESFNSAESFRHYPVVVDDVVNVDKPGGLPLFGYMLVNSSRTGYLLIRNSTREHWIQEEFANSWGTNKLAYLCPKEFVTYHVL